MPNVPTLEKRIAILFKNLDKRPSAAAFPAVGYLAQMLNDLAKETDNLKSDTANISPMRSCLFASYVNVP